MEINTKLTEKDFIGLNFALLFRRVGFKIIAALAILLTLYSVIISIIYHKPLYFSTLAWPLIIIILFPLLTYVGARVNYRSNARIKEPIEYKFEKDIFEIKGESFTTQLTWQKVFKVVKTKQWLFIYQSRQVANVIPLRDIWEGDLTTLKEILNSHAVKNNL